MIISVIAIAVILLITYWWSNNGAFSALVHFLCVVTSGAIAFGVWEPLSYLPVFILPTQSLVSGALLAVALGIIAGALPAWQAMQLKIADALRRGG